MTDVRTFLIKQKFIEPHTLPQSGEFRIICPDCNNPKQKCYINAEGKGVKCFHCPFSKSWLGFIRLYEPPSPQEQALEKFVSRAQQNLLENETALAYLEARGVSKETVEAYRLGYLPSGDTAEPTDTDKSLGLFTTRWSLEGRIIIPYLRDGYPLTVRGRAFDDGIEPKYKGLNGSNALPFNPPSFDYQKSLFICEGEFDALLMNQLGYQAIGLPGAQVGENFIDLFQKFTKVYLCLDGDEAGRKGVNKFKRLLSEVYEVVLPESQDVSEYIGMYGKESFQALVDNALFFVGNRLQQDDSLKSAVDQWEDWAWTNGELLGPKITWAPRLEKSLSGWSRGLFLIGALPNSGKSCFFVKSAYEAARDNPDDTIVVYLTLDDDQEDAMCRLVSLHTNISFEEIRMPKIVWDNPSDSSKRNPERLKYVQQKLIELRGMNNLVIRDARYGRSLQYIRSYTAMLRKRYQDKHIILFIDSLAKLTQENEPDNISIVNWKAHLATELKYLTTLHNLCIVTPADFRKINDFRRPTNDDLKDAAELAYEANCVLLGFNEANLKGISDATLKWTDPNTNIEWPILEMNLSKNKKSMHKGVVRFRFYPPTSNFMELTEEEDAQFTKQLKEKEAQQRSARRNNETDGGSYRNPVFDNTFQQPRNFGFRPGLSQNTRTTY